MQIALKSTQTATPLRNLTAEHIGKLIKVSGIIVSASRVKSKAVGIQIRCSRCGKRDFVECRGSFAQITLPARCNSVGSEDCGSSPYVIVPDDCLYIDQQNLKLQEAPETVPTGEMPRSTLVVVDRGLVDVAAPGARVSILGVLSLFERKNANLNLDGAIAAIRLPYLRVVGIDLNVDGHGDKFRHFTPAEEDRFLELSRRPNIHKLVAASIAPSIQGEYTLDIKKALACQLMGGCPKLLPDGVKLRGDVNVLLLGDPSTAKSQFLKFIEKVAPVGVYTSGKGSSAAGLTASVIRDKNKEFFLEGGAMVLADGGICCIDEFDKMRETDRVAIHEAMEQQTISIAKAGITTVLNSRTSVLAAANPVYGRYDDLRSAAENIDMMSTILSRFDCIFIIRDVRDENRDLSIAKHVMGVHMKASNLTSLGSQKNPTNIDSSILDLKSLKDYVAYCRSRCSPRLNNETAALLSSEYVAIRRAIKERGDHAGGRKHQAVPVTVRQLEALVRLAESLAKMRLETTVQPRDVHEALRLFKVSTMNAASAAPQTSGVELRFLGDAERLQVQNAEQFLKQRVPVGADAKTMLLIDEGVALGHSDFALKRAVKIMSNRAELTELDKGRRLRRLR
mmetsp:Transcript_4360/g.13789  ORF Transcript_4360/g.13789 Transcript_4360/m.13789 type:complete len:622 (+) Transcript_4360:460-2325(+)